MCRILAVYSKKQEFSIEEYLKKFADIAKNSKEYQGHGWGCSYRVEGNWRTYRNISPVWQDDLAQFGKTRLLLVHARSAFRDEGIIVENNMPFCSGKNIFIFNGELRGVKIKAEGRIGAEKIFNYILRFDKGDLFEALQKGITIIEKRSVYLRAVNILMSDGKNIYLTSQFNEDPDYFTMSCKETDSRLIICSDPFSGEKDWSPVAKGTFAKYPVEEKL